ncbi:MAG: arginine--tRNA ligase [Patescibacteria group bacterium]
MLIKDTIKEQINQVLRDKYSVEDALFQVEYPPQPELGDYSCNVAMVLSKKLGKNPMEIGEEILDGLGDFVKQFEKVEVVRQGFINFFLSEDFLQENLENILKEKEKFGSSKIRKGEVIIIDYSAPNVAKNMHAGHIRSTIIGDALARIFEFLGCKVISDNHMGDWGTQYGILLYEYKNKYGEEKKEGLTIDELEEMYVDFMEKEKNKPEIRDLAKAELKKLQDKDKINYNLWQYFYKISLNEFKQTYQKLNIRPFDLWHGESFYHELLQDIVDEALDKNVAEKSDGAIIISLDKFNLPPGMIQKSDGTFLYLTTDLATIKYRYKRYKPDLCVYVVANQQTLHFEQLFSANKILKFSGKEDLVHVKFGLILDEDGKKMSTRKGKVIKLDSLIDEIIDKARGVVEDKNSDLSETEKNNIARVVGIGALKFNDLSQNRTTDILFDWKRMLSFESGSAPYLHYTYVRIQSILDKAKIKLEKNNFKNLKEKQEILLLKNLSKFEEIITQSAEEYKPNIIANYLTNLASDFHRFYEQVPILKSEEKIQTEKLGLILAVAQVIKNGLDLLGIEVVDKM